MLTSRYWTDRLPSMRVDRICITCLTPFSFFFLSFCLFRCSMPKNKKKGAVLQDSMYSCALYILVGALQAVDVRGGQTIHSNLNVSVNRKDASFW